MRREVIALVCLLAGACQQPAPEPYIALCRPDDLAPATLRIGDIEIPPDKMTAQLHQDEVMSVYGVAIRLQKAEAARLAQVTRERLGQPLEIALDDKVVTQPVVQTPVLDGSILVTGGFTRIRAETIVRRLSPPCTATQDRSSNEPGQPPQPSAPPS